MKTTMKGALLPGNSTVVFKDFPVPAPGNGEVLIKVRASTICGSDIRAIYKEHLGVGAEAYQNVIAGHEPAGIVEVEGTGLRRFKKGDRVVIYHISGCGMCNNCRRGNMISCLSETYRRAYGWQRNGGMAEYLLAEEKDLVLLPDNLSYLDGAQVACGFGTAYEALCKITINGGDVVLVTGLGPVGLATLMLAKAMGASCTIGMDINEDRIALAREKNLITHAVRATPDAIKEILALTGGKGVEKSIDCSANAQARKVCIQATREWGNIAFVGEGGSVEFDPSKDLMHGSKTIFGSWVTSLWRMEELVERLSRWNIHPHDLITHTFSLDKADEAYALMASGKCGKVAVVPA